MSSDKSFYSFLVPKIKLSASIVRTISQSLNSDKSISAPEYRDALAICLIHPKDMKLIGIKEGNLRITSDFGSVVVKAIESEKEVEEGMVILPLGPWANQISGGEGKRLCLKNFTVKVEVSKEAITDIKSLYEKNDK